jgi:hypothetical protein
MLSFLPKQLGPSPKKNIYIDESYPAFEHEVHNSLDAIVLVTTFKESISQRFTKFLEHLVSVTTSPSKDIDFVISSNASMPIEHSILQKLKYLFKEVKLHAQQIPKQDDIYESDAVPFASSPYIPEMGRTSGPNILFLNTMNYCRQYNTVLVLETDCILYNSWIEKCKNYTNNCEYFLLSGTTYDGIPTSVSEKNLVNFLHINGVAFYKTGSSVFQYVMLQLEEFIKDSVSRKVRQGRVPYDLAITEMILSRIANTPTVGAYNFWRCVYRYILKNTLIVNASCERDTEVKPSDLLAIHKNCVILHKKLL